VIMLALSGVCCYCGEGLEVSSCGDVAYYC